MSHKRQRNEAARLEVLLRLGIQATYRRKLAAKHSGEISVSALYECRAIRLTAGAV